VVAKRPIHFGTATAGDTRNLAQLLARILSSHQTYYHL
jgi:hypothetical protein